MQYKKVKIEKKIDSACDFKIFRTNENLSAEPGQFVFAWIPGVGEKPLSIMDDKPLTLSVLERGEFTKKFNSLGEEDCFYIRGPYGKKLLIDFNLDIVLVGGGCGIAGLYLMARRASKRLNNKELIILLGAKNKEHIPYLDVLKKYGEVFIATEDGSLGLKGKVTDLFKKLKLTQECYFFNCGSEAMIEAIMPLELNISKPEKIYSSLDYMTKCGVGLCGSCATKNGRRLCVDGPFMNGC